MSSKTVPCYDFIKVINKDEWDISKLVLFEGTTSFDSKKTVSLEEMKNTEIVELQETKLYVDNWQ